MNGIVAKKRPEPSVRKRAHERSITVNMTLPPLLFEEGRRLAKEGGYTGLSDYFQACIRVNAGIGLPKTNKAV